MRKKSLENVIEEARKVHNNFYDYRKIAEYKGCDSKVIITCPIHGDFKQSFYNHINKKQGCPKCGFERSNARKRLTKDEILKRIKEYGYKIDGELIYKNNLDKINLICERHGKFSITLGSLSQGERCKKCSREKANKKITLSQDEFLKRLHSLYGDSIDTSKVEYKGQREKVCIICKKHGEFYATPNSLYKGICCNECKKETLSQLRRKTNEEFLKEFKTLYGDSLLSDKINYRNESSPIIIGCKIHGYYSQNPRVTLQGNGCKLCNSSKLEKKTYNKLLQESIDFKREFQVPNSLLRLDFYLPKYNVAIECQGKQHFDIVEHFGGLDEYNKVSERDARKKKICDEHDLKIFYYSNLKYNTFLGEKVYHDIDELISYIKENYKIS